MESLSILEDIMSFPIPKYMIINEQESILKPTRRIIPFIMYKHTTIVRNELHRQQMPQIIDIMAL